MPLLPAPLLVPSLRLAEKGGVKEHRMDSVLLSHPRQRGEAKRGICEWWPLGLPEGICGDDASRPRNSYRVLLFPAREELGRGCHARLLLAWQTGEKRGEGKKNSCLNSVRPVRVCHAFHCCKRNLAHRPPLQFYRCGTLICTVINVQSCTKVKRPCLNSSPALRLGLFHASREVGRVGHPGLSPRLCRKSCFVPSCT